MKNRYVLLLFNSILIFILCSFLMSSCAFDVMLGEDSKDNYQNTNTTDDDDDDDNTGDDDDDGGLIPIGDDDDDDIPPIDPPSINLYHGVRTTVSGIDNIAIVNGRIIESGTQPISIPTVNLDNVTGINGYSNLVEACNNLSSPLGTFNMTIDAGRATVPVTARTNIANLSAPLTYPIVLSQPDTEYILSEDLTSPGDAIHIAASNITLNLNGHTITYGTLGNCHGNVYGNGCNPINFHYNPGHSEVAGLEIVYHSPDSDGIYAYETQNMNIHHNTWEDQGDFVTDRHQGISVIHSPGGDFNTYHHNLITSARQSAIRGGQEDCQAYNNELYVNSYHTNSSGISCGGIGSEANRSRIYRNKIIARGYLPIGIWPDDHTEIYSNFVYAERTRGQTQPGNEYENPHGTCYRQTWGDNDVIATCNHLELKAGRLVPGTSFYSRGKAVWIGLTEVNQTEILQHNFIRGTNDDGVSRAQAIAVLYNFPSNLIFRDNVISSNFSNVTLADDYGQADGYPQFIRNHFVKENSYDTYDTIKSEYSSRPSTGIFMDSTFANGASFDDIDLELCGSGNNEIVIGHSEGITQVIDYYITNNTTTRDSGSSYDTLSPCGYRVYP